MKTRKCRHRANKRHFVLEDRPRGQGASSLTSDEVLQVTKFEANVVLASRVN
jgi:hypothetical protein